MDSNGTSHDADTHAMLRSGSSIGVKTKMIMVTPSSNNAGHFDFLPSILYHNIPISPAMAEIPIPYTR